MPWWSVRAHTAGVMLSRARFTPEKRDRLLTPAFIRLTVADLAYFTANGVAIYTLSLWVTGPVGSDKSGAGLAFEPSTSQPCSSVRSPAASPTPAGGGRCSWVGR
jgi:hypothetical protein